MVEQIYGSARLGLACNLSKKQHVEFSILSFFTLAVILSAPIPNGSNRPIFWMIWASIISLLMIFSLFATARRSRVPWGGWVNVCPIFALGFGLVLFSILQILPLQNSANWAQNRISFAPSASVLAVVRMLSYAGLFFLVLQWGPSPAKMATLSRFLFVGITIHALAALVFLYALGDFYPWGEKLQHRGFATGTFVNRNAFASFMAMGLILGICQLWQNTNTEGINLAYFAGIAIIFLGLTATQSRSAIVFVLITSAFCWFLRGDKKRRPKLSLPLIGVVLLGLIISFLSVAERSVYTVVDLQNRLELWRQTLRMIAERPLVGFGLDGFGSAFERYHQPPLPSDVVWHYPHSTYLTLWAELGVIAGSLPVLAVTCALIFLLKSRKIKPEGRPLSLAAIGAIIFAGLHAIVDFSFEIQANVFFLITLVAMGLAEAMSPISAELEVQNDETGD